MMLCCSLKLKVQKTYCQLEPPAPSNYMILFNYSTSNSLLQQHSRYLFRPALFAQSNLPGIEWRSFDRKINQLQSESKWIFLFRRHSLPTNSDVCLELISCLSDLIISVPLPTLVNHSDLRIYIFTINERLGKVPKRRGLSSEG